VMRRCFPATRAALYWMVQFAGAICAALVLTLFFGPLIARGVNTPGPAVGPLQAAGWETMLTLILVFVILSTADQKAVVGKNAALAVGFTVALDGLFGSPVSGASMNPARSLAPAIVSGHLQHAWIYLAGPLAGTIVAVLLTYGILGAPKPDAEEAAQGQFSTAT